MKKEELKPIFEKPFQGVESFKNNIITPIFGNISPLNKSFKNQFNNLEKDIFADVICFGKLELATDGDEMQFFDVVLRPNVMLSRNRVTIQNFIRRELLPYNAALIVFHYPDNSGEWRISFVSKGKNAADSTSAKRYTYLLGENQTCRTAAERFEILSNKDKTLENITDAFSVEKLSDEFFDKYRSMYADFVQFITGKRVVKEEGKWVEKKIDEVDEQLQSSFDGDEKSVRDYIKKMLGRLVFLQFLQKKGWLGVPVDKEWGEGNQHYLQNLFANSDAKDDFLDAVLEILFFDTLNANRDNQLGDPVLGDNIKIPYLNGGLFERDELDEKTVKFPADLFKELLQFFSEYNFTIDENDPNDAEVGVDPEMLGRIFENLLEDNKDKGAFYTPKEIVQYMCRESLISYLSTDAEFMSDKVRTLVTEYCTDTLSDDEKQLLDTKLKEVKICDPAIGSGAFPMGMLNEIYRCRVAIEGKSEKVAEIKKHIIQQSIYGVDIEQGAVDIARLRFWLALVVDEEKPQPLPNLDYKIMQGNSLLESFEGIDLSKLSTTNLAVIEPQYDLFGNLENNQLSISYTNSEDVLRLQNYIKSYFDVENHDRKHELKQLIDNEIHNQIDLAISKYEEGILFKISNLGVEDKRSNKQQKEIDALNNELIQLANKRKKLEELQNTNIKPFFLWKLYFKEVFDENKRGFDICIGNPPYGAKLSLEEKRNFQISFETARTIPGIQKGSLDTYTLFIEQGFNLLKTNGNLSYIVPISFTSSDSLTGVHELLMKSCKIIRVSSYSVRPQPVFKNAVVNTSVISFVKTNCKCEQIFSTKMYRKNNDFNLQHLLDNLEFIDVKEYKLAGRIPKISYEIERNILEKLFSFKTSIGDLKQSSGTPIYYRTTGGRYFKVITNYSTGSTKEKAINFEENIANICGCILSSNLFFWFYQIYSNNLDLKSYEIESFTIPIERIDQEMIEVANNLYSEYLEDIEKYSNTRQTQKYANIDSFKEYKIGKSKTIIDRIDDLIAPLYNLNINELNFIKNFDIEYRLSDEE